MTKYILHGGETSNITKNNELFFKQFTATVNKSQIKILMCYWSRQKNEWDKFPTFELESQHLVFVTPF